MPTKYIVIALALLLSHTSIFFAGYYKRGETEAEKTTVAITEAIEAEIEVQDDLIEIGLDHADKEIAVKVEERLIKKEVKEHVKEINDTDICYANDGVQLINQALGYTKSENNTEHVKGQLP